MRRLHWFVIIGVLGSAGFSDCGVGGDSDAPHGNGGSGVGASSNGSGAGDGAGASSSGGSEGNGGPTSPDGSGCYSIEDCPELSCVCGGVHTTYLCEGSCSDASDECVDGTIEHSANCTPKPEPGGEGGDASGGGESGGVVCGSSDARCVEYTRHECDVCDEGACTDDQECYAMWECETYWDACPSYFQCVMAGSSCDEIMACEPCDGG